MTDLSSLDRLLERFPEQEPVSPLPWAPYNAWGHDAAGFIKVLRVGPEAGGGIAGSHGTDLFGFADDFQFAALAANAYPELRSALVALRDENKALSEKVAFPNRDLHRRVQAAEAAMRVTVEECKRQGVSLGRLLANGYAAALEVRAEKAEAERDEARRLAERWCIRGFGKLLPWELGAPAAGREEETT